MRRVRDDGFMRGVWEMGLYLLQYAYTPEAWSKQIKEEDGDIGAARKIADKLGGKLVSGWFTFGDYDVVAILEMPDNVTAGAVSVALSAAGYAKAAKTTHLITEGDGVAMLRKAKSAKTSSVKK